MSAVSTAKTATPNPVAASVRRGLEQALAFASGAAAPSDVRVHVPPTVDVRATREKLGLTQEQFAGRFGFSINTLRHWEEGKRVPEGPARAYLQVIDRAPETVERALRMG
jgi:putative transcriptional regulator